MFFYSLHLSWQVYLSQLNIKIIYFLAFQVQFSVLHRPFFLPFKFCLLPNNFSLVELSKLAQPGVLPYMLHPPLQMLQIQVPNSSCICDSMSRVASSTRKSLSSSFQLTQKNSFNLYSNLKTEPHL